MWAAWPIMRPDQVVLVEGMSEFAKGAVYGGMLEGFKAAFGDAIDLREHAGHEEVPAEGRRIWAGVAFDFSRGASSDFPASSVVIGGRCATRISLRRRPTYPRFKSRDRRRSMRSLRR